MVEGKAAFVNPWRPGRIYFSECPTGRQSHRRRLHVHVDCFRMADSTLGAHGVASSSNSARPSPAHVARLADLALQVGDHLPIRQPAIVRRFRERGQLAPGASSTRFTLTRPAKSSTGSTLSRAIGASLIVRPSPWPRETPLSAQLRLSKAEADATCEHQCNRAGEAVLVLKMKLWMGEHLLRKLSSDTMDRFQTRVGLGGERESKCLQIKMHLGGVRF